MCTEPGARPEVDAVILTLQSLTSVREGPKAPYRDTRSFKILEVHPMGALHRA